MTRPPDEMLVEVITRALAERYSPTHTANPAYKGYRRTPDVEPDIERPMSARMGDTCMTTFDDTDGHRSLRALTYTEVAAVAVEAITALQLDWAGEER